MRFVVWILFGASMVGMLVSALLCSAKVRDALVNAWVAVSDHRERSSADSARHLAIPFISALYLGPDGRLRKRKTLLLGFLAATIYRTVTGGFIPEPDEEPIDPLVLAFMSAAGFWVSVALSTPVHWLCEHLSARAFLATFRQCAAAPMPKLLLALIAAWAGVLTLVNLFALLVRAGIQYLGAIESPWFFTGYILGHIFGMNAAVYIPWALVDIGWALPRQRGLDALEAVMVGVAAMTYALVLIAVLLALVLAHNRSVLGVISDVLAHVSVTQARRLFGASFVAFGLATGLMQALSF